MAGGRASLPTQVNSGSGDNDIFAYDPNTMRTTQYQFNINGQSSTDALTWNANGSLQKLAITDVYSHTGKRIQLAGELCVQRLAFRSGLQF